MSAGFWGELMLDPAKVDADLDHALLNARHNRRAGQMYANHNRPAPRGEHYPQKRAMCGVHQGTRPHTIRTAPAHVFAAACNRLHLPAPPTPMPVAARAGAMHCEMDAESIEICTAH